MQQPKIKKLTKALSQNKAVEFIHNGFYYEVFESINGGYIVNLYSSDIKDAYGSYLDGNIIDGGLCTGGAEDAIGFML
jgi:hypothetical protein